MGFWLNNLSEFEMKRNRENRLILNFSYVSDGGGSGTSDSVREPLPKNIKVFARQNVKVPTGFLMSSKAAVVENTFREREHLGRLPLRIIERGKFEVIEVEAPNNPSLLKELEELGFQTGSYTKLLRYDGFYPERKVSLENLVLADSMRLDEIELPNLDNVGFGDFLTLEEARELPYVVLDIEKPLWKKDREKELLDLRTKLLKAKPDEKSEKRKRIVYKIEERLFWNHPEVDGANLYDEKFRADVSYVGAVWRNGDVRIKELYMIDARGEVEAEEHNGFKILKFKNEKEVIEALTLAFKERKPLVAIGHNQVYDYSQIKYAADDLGLVFDPAVEDIKPRRDFVHDFIQRQKEDLIYIDTLWFGKIKHPYLNQKRFGTSFKLGDLATYLGLDFKKSLTHEQLREVEMRRLAGKTLEIRMKAASDMINYSCADIEVTEDAFHILDPWPFLVEMKKVLPFCTYTEIAFAPNVMNKLHERRHFLDARNLPFHAGMKQFWRLEEIKEFKKKAPKLKADVLKAVGIERAPKGIYGNVTEYYFPLERQFFDSTFRVNPELEDAYNNLKGSHELAFFQYLRSYMVQIFSDYYHVNMADENKNKWLLEKRFCARYGFNTHYVREKIREGYKNLAREIKENGMNYIDHIGDYIFVQGEGETNLTSAIKIRTLEEFYHKVTPPPTFEQLLE